MADVSKLKINGVSYDIKDAEARSQLSTVQEELSNKGVTNYAKARFAMLGDSNSVGYGWQQEEDPPDWNTPKGIFTILPEYFPDAIFNTPLRAYTWNTVTDATYNMVYQATQIVGTPDVIITWCGGNDISWYSNNHQGSLGYPDFDEWDSSNFDDTTTYGGMNKCLHYLRTTYPHAKIVGVIRTWKDGQSVEQQKSIYGMINAIYKKYNCAVINLNDYSSICDRIAAQKSLYFSDAIHYNELAFRELITPVFVGEISSGLNSTTNIDVETIYTDVSSGEFDYTTIPRYLGDYFKTSGAVRVRNYNNSYQNLLIFQTAGSGRHDNLNAIRLRSNNEDISYIRYDYNTGLITTSNFNKTYELTRTGIDAKTVPEGDYKITYNTLGNWSNLPIVTPQLLIVRQMSNLNKYYMSITFDHTKFFTGTHYYDSTEGISDHYHNPIIWSQVVKSFLSRPATIMNALTAPDGIYTITTDELNHNLWTNISDKIAPCTLIIRTAVSTGMRYYEAIRWDHSIVAGSKGAQDTSITWAHTFRDHKTSSEETLDPLTAEDGIYTIIADDLTGDNPKWTNVQNIAPCMLIIKTASTNFKYYIALRYDNTFITGTKHQNNNTITWHWFPNS